jgi:hypothetical protein
MERAARDYGPPRHRIIRRQCRLRGLLGAAAGNATMSEDEDKAFGIDPEQRQSYVRLDKGKVNLAPPARTAVWFKLVGVQHLHRLFMG